MTVVKQLSKHDCTYPYAQSTKLTLSFTIFSGLMEYIYLSVTDRMW